MQRKNVESSGIDITKNNTLDGTISTGFAKPFISDFRSQCPAHFSEHFPQHSHLSLVILFGGTLVRSSVFDFDLEVSWSFVLRCRRRSTESIAHGANGSRHGLEILPHWIRADFTPTTQLLRVWCLDNRCRRCRRIRC